MRDIGRVSAICSAIMMFLRVLEGSGYLEEAFSKMLEGISWPRGVADKFLTLLTKLIGGGLMGRIRGALGRKPSLIPFILFLMVDIYYLSAPYLGLPV